MKSLREDTFEDWNMVISYDKEIFEPLYDILIEKIEKRIDKFLHSFSEFTPTEILEAAKKEMLR